LGEIEQLAIELAWRVSELFWILDLTASMAPMAVIEGQAVS
jgi:hypothetical protein